MSAASSVYSDAKPPAKRMRKGTHSCTECRRRKKSCIVLPGHDKCTECTGRSVQCISQEPVPVEKRPRVESKQGLQERIVRLESTVQAIIDRLEGGDNIAEDSGATLQRLRSDLQPPTPASNGPSPDTQLDSAPVFSLFNNTILNRKDHNEATEAGNGSSPASPAGIGDDTPKIANIRRKLLSLFPPPEIEDMLVQKSRWWNTWHDMFPHIFGASHGTEAFRQSVSSSKTSKSIQKVARALLCVSLALQEMPGLNEQFNDQNKDSRLPESRLPTSSAARNRTEECLAVVDELILSNDELAGTIDGIECLLLQAKHDSNNGRIRRTWIYHRRGIFLAQLLGLHRHSKQEGQNEAEVERRQSIWTALFQGDRFFSLLLGLPYAVSSKHCDMYIAAGSMPWKYMHRLGEISGRVIDRNHETSPNDSYSETIAIEGQMANFAASMPPQWWDVDSLDSLGFDEVAQQMYSRLLPQFWHHQTRTLLHLPFMLKATQDRRYEFNRIAALESARGMIVRYKIIRPVQGFQSLICKIIDFQVFTSAMLLVLNLIGSSMTSPDRLHQDDSGDWRLVSETYDILQRASYETEGLVASQAARALGLFMKAKDGNCSINSGTTKVTIPYFGTVAFGPGKEVSKPPSAAPSYAQQPLQLPTPAETLGQSPASDPFISFESYLAQMPFDFDFGPGPQEYSPPDAQDGILANVNLDLDQDWAWSLQ
ncbi:MAG: hypothetical protein Q9191_005856 [Dirinaria sp. TL-2023a]